MPGWYNWRSPCQSWSEAGSRKGIDDSRGKLFYEYIRVLDYIQPKFFVAENVSGLLHSRNQQAFHNIRDILSQNYCVNYKLVNTKNYETPQDERTELLLLDIINHRWFKQRVLNLFANQANSLH